MNDARERRKPRIGVRARLAEGLDLRIPRRGGGSDREEDAGDQRVATVGHTIGHTVENVVSSSAASSSGSEGLRLVRVRQLELVWWSRNSGAACEASAWAPVCPPGTVSLGTAIVPSFRAPTEAFVVRAPWLTTATATASASGASPMEDPSPVDPSPPTDWRSPVAPSVGFDRVYGDSGSRLRKNPGVGTVAVWRPRAPPGYVAIGNVVTPNHSPPNPTEIACVRNDLARASAPAPAPLWTTAGAEAKLGRVPSRFTGRGCARARGGWRWRRATPGTPPPPAV